MKKITVYSTTTCPYCKKLVHWLDDHKLEYTEYKVDLNPYAAQTMVMLSGQMGVPFTTVEEGGEQTGVLGFDEPRFKELLGV